MFSLFTIHELSQPTCRAFTAHQWAAAHRLEITAVVDQQDSCMLCSETELANILQCGYNIKT